MKLSAKNNYLSGISVIVNTLNDENDIGDMLNSISKSKPSQIIVVDGTSNDNTVKVAKEYTDEVYVIKKGISRQHIKALEFVSYEYLLVLECDHRYPDSFIDNLYSEYIESGYFGLQATLECSLKRSFLEKGMALFYEINQLKKGERAIISGPSIWKTDEYIKIFNEPSKMQGFSYDTNKAETLKENNLRVGLGYTVAFQHQELDYKTFFRKYFYYGKGDYDFYETYKTQWTTKRKLKSIFHVFNRYIVDYPIKSFKIGKPYIAIPYLWASAVVRYSGWAYSFLRSFRGVRHQK